MLYYGLLSLKFVNSSLKQTSQPKLVTQSTETRVNLITEAGAQGLLLFNLNGIFWVILLFCHYSVPTRIAKPTSCNVVTQYLKMSISKMFYNLLGTSENTQITQKSMSFPSSVLSKKFRFFYQNISEKSRICLVSVCIFADSMNFKINCSFWLIEKLWLNYFYL